jgi:hypothetical protein
MKATKALIMSDPMTDGQKELIDRVIEDAKKKAIKVINPDNPAAQRIITRGNELVDVIIDKMHELSLEFPEMPCFGIADWQKFYGIKLTPGRMAIIANFPWSEKTLNAPCPFHPGKMIRETHFAFVGLDAITIMKLQKINPKETEPRFYSYAPDAWYSQQSFATVETLKLRWYLLLKNIVPNSENKTFDEQKAMLPKEYEVPSAIAETTKDFLVHKKTGIYANSNRYARTNDLASDGRRVRVGFCAALGVAVDAYWGGFRLGSLGVGASRKFPS